MGDVAEAVAWFGYAPQLAFTVALETCTKALAEAAMSPNEQLSVCDGADPLIEQEPGPLYAGLIDKLTPVPQGSGSLNVTPVAVPGPVFDTVMPKPMLSPALTSAASATFWICKPGHCTVVDAPARTSAFASIT